MDFKYIRAFPGVPFNTFCNYTSISHFYAFFPFLVFIRFCIFSNIEIIARS